MLPQILEVQGYEETLPEVIVRTAMDAGPAKTRRRFTAAVTPIKGHLVLREEQASRLKMFHDVDCAGGALSFQWQTSRSVGDTDSSEITATDDVSDTDLLLLGRNFRFVTPPVFRGLGAQLIEALLDLEIMP